VSQNTRTSFVTSRSRAKCVIRCGALSTNVKRAGTVAAQPSTIFAVGIPVEGVVTSTVENHSA